MPFQKYFFLEDKFINVLPYSDTYDSIKKWYVIHMKGNLDLQRNVCTSSSAETEEVVFSVMGKLVCFV